MLTSEGLIGPKRADKPPGEAWRRAEKLPTEGRTSWRSRS
jgi:hypothetical protein